jgi:hypothetical protein
MGTAAGPRLARGRSHHLSWEGGKMIRSAAILVAMAAFACGQQSGDRGVSAAPEGARPEGAQRCLDLVEEGRFADAVDPCAEAVQELPDDAELVAALEKAKSEVATQ